MYISGQRIRKYFTALLAAATVLVLAKPLLAEKVLDVQLRTIPLPSSNAGSALHSDVLTTLPPDFYPSTAGTYYLGIWVKDISGSPGAIQGGYLDLSYDGDHIGFTDLSRNPIFDTLDEGTINNASGLIDDLGGLTFDTDKGDDEWALVRGLTFDWDGTKTVIQSAEGDPQFAKSGTGENVPWNQVNLDSVVVPEPSCVVLLALGSTLLLKRRRA